MKINGGIIMDFTKIKNILALYKPEILFGAGLVCQAAAVPVAIVGEKKAEQNRIDYEMKWACEESSPTKKDQLLYVGKQIACYAPAVALEVGGASLSTSGFNEEKSRLTASIAAYTGLAASFAAYRQRVRDDKGVEADEKYALGYVPKPKKDEEPVEYTPELGAQLNSGSPYSFFFDSTSTLWTKDPEANKATLYSAQARCNHLLRANGHLFLNEVFDELGMPRTQAGAIVGWCLGNGDDEVDFGLENSNSEASRRFINGYEAVALLDFNVDGIIWDKIKCDCPCIGV